MCCEHTYNPNVLRLIDAKRFMPKELFLTGNGQKTFRVYIKFDEAGATLNFIGDCYDASFTT